MSNLSFDSFTKKIHIKAPIEKLYWCWATTEGICTWFLNNAVYTDKNNNIKEPDKNIEAGDLYKWKWHNWDETEEGVILKANGSDFLEFSFAGTCKVSVTLETKEETVLLSLLQYDIPTDDANKLNIHYGCSNGWTFWLANLKAYLEHDILLNETDIDLRNIPLAGFEFVNM